MEPEDADSYDEELLAAVAELLPIMATSLGPQTLAPVFQQLFYDPLMKRLQAGQPDGVRSTMTGKSADGTHAGLLPVPLGLASGLRQTLACS